MLYYLEPISLALKSHICQNTGCLACELGVLFYTLDVSDDKITDIDSFIQVLAWNTLVRECLHIFV